MKFLCKEAQQVLFYFRNSLKIQWLNVAKIHKTCNRNATTVA